MFKSKRERDREAAAIGAKMYGPRENVGDASVKTQHTFVDSLGREQIIEAQTVDEAWEFLSQLQKIPVGDLKKTYKMMDAPAAGSTGHGLDAAHT